MLKTPRTRSFVFDEERFQTALKDDHGDDFGFEDLASTESRQISEALELATDDSDLPAAVHSPRNAEIFAYPIDSDAVLLVVRSRDTWPFVQVADLSIETKRLLDLDARDPVREIAHVVARLVEEANRLLPSMRAALRAQKRRYLARRTEAAIDWCFAKTAALVRAIRAARRRHARAQYGAVTEAVIDCLVDRGIRRSTLEPIDEELLWDRVLGPAIDDAEDLLA